MTTTTRGGRSEGQGEDRCRGARRRGGSAPPHPHPPTLVAGSDLNVPPSPAGRFVPLVRLKRVVSQEWAGLPPVGA
jgi:hypothetical protein